MPRPGPAGGANSAPPDLLVGFRGEERKGKGRGKGRARRKERERKWSGRGVEERRQRQREGRGMEREEFCAVVRKNADAGVRVGELAVSNLSYETVKFCRRSRGLTDRSGRDDPSLSLPVNTRRAVTLIITSRQHGPSLSLPVNTRWAVTLNTTGRHCHLPSTPTLRRTCAAWATTRCATQKWNLDSELNRKSTVASTSHRSLRRPEPDSRLYMHAVK